MMKCFGCGKLSPPGDDPALEPRTSTCFLRALRISVHLALWLRRFYARYIDQFEDTTCQASSLVLYLNHQRSGRQRPATGTTPAPRRSLISPRTPFTEVWPEGTLVVFGADFGTRCDERGTRLSLTRRRLRRASNPLEQDLAWASLAPNV